MRQTTLACDRGGGYAASGRTGQPGEWRCGRNSHFHRDAAMVVAHGSIMFCFVLVCVMVELTKVVCSLPQCPSESVGWNLRMLCDSSTPCAVCHGGKSFQAALRALPGDISNT